MKKLFLAATALVFTSALSAAGGDDTKRQSKLQKLCDFFMESEHPCHEEGADESILDELAKREILDHAEFKSNRICTGRPFVDGE